MKKSIAMKWVAELRSGKHRQTVGVLKRGDGSMCCLGVLCSEVLKLPHELYNGKYSFDDSVGDLSKKARKLSGISTSLAYSVVMGVRLSALNDSGLYEEGLEPFTFDEIADLIQINWRDL